MSESQEPSGNREENETTWTTSSNTSGQVQEENRGPETETRDDADDAVPSFEEAARARLEEMEEENAELRLQYSRLQETLEDIQTHMRRATIPNSPRQRSELGQPDPLTSPVNKMAEKERMAHLQAIKNSIPVFHGKSLDPGSTIEFIEKASLYITLSGLPEAEKCQYICTRFQENALHWHREQIVRTPEVQSNWTKLEKAIRERFLPLDFKFTQFQKLLALRQGTNSIQHHVEEFSKVISITYGLSEIAKVCIFLNGVNNSIAKPVRSVLENLSSLDRAITAAVRIGKGDDTARNEQGTENRALLMGSSIQDPRTFCWRCLQPGHFAKGCIKQLPNFGRGRGNQQTLPWRGTS
jgi:Retrotransposon gag protein